MSRAIAGWVCAMGAVALACDASGVRTPAGSNQPPPVTLRLETVRIGPGTIALDPPGGRYPKGTVVTVTAVPDDGYQFSGWGGALSGAAPQTTLALNADAQISATFTAPLPEIHALRVQKTGAGTVSLDPPGGSYPKGTMVVLSALPDGGHRFAGWGGALSGDALRATLTMDADQEVTATFVQAPGTTVYTVTVHTVGSGSVALDPAGGSYAPGTVVTLAATPAPDHQFARWEGALTGTEPETSLTLQADAAITATFEALPPAEPASLGSVFPSTIQAGARAQSLLVNGAYFTKQSIVMVDGEARPTTFVSASQLAAQLTAADLATPGSRAVAVQASDGSRAGPVNVAVVATLPAAAVPTLTVDLGEDYRDVTRVGSGSLYGLVEDGADTSTGLFATPSALVDPLRPRMFRQPAPNHRHLPNGERVIVADALEVAPKAARAGAKVTILMPEMYPDFPYTWSGWTDWNRKVDQIVDATLQSGATNVYGYELWNEPNWTWDAGRWGSFDDFWKGTAQRIRARDPAARLISPSIDKWDAGWMQSFLTRARDAGVLPDVVAWHELGMPEGDVREQARPWFIADHVAAYRQIEKSLGIGPLPISLNEYAVQREEGVPGANIRYLAQFERNGVDSACASFWFRPGRLGNLLTDRAQPNGGWWLYKWYGDMAGRMAMATSSRPRQLSLDGIASVDAAAKTAHVVFGGTDGEVVVSLRGLAAAGFTSGTVHVKAEATPYLGADTAVPAPLALFEGDFRIAGDRLVLPFRGLDKTWGYHVLLTASGTARTRFEAEDAALTGVSAVAHSAASSDRYVGPLGATGDAVRFTVEAPSAGTYALEIGYANGGSTDARQALTVNGTAGPELVYPSTSGGFAQGKGGTIRAVVALRAGPNTLELAKGSAGAVELDHLQLSPAGPFVARVEAERATLTGSSRVHTSSFASSGALVAFIDGSSSVEFTIEGVPSAGSYTLEIGYFNGNGGNGTQSVSVNQGSTWTLSLPSTGGWGIAVPNFGTRKITTMPVTLRQGTNKIRFTAAGPSLELDYVEVR